MTGPVGLADTSPTLRISGAIPARYRAALADLVTTGFAGLDASGVEIHLRSRPPRTFYTVRYEVPLGSLGDEARAWWQERNPGAATGTFVRRTRQRREAERLADHHGVQVERHVDERLAERMSGCAYYGLPAMARVAPGTRYLVTLKVPQNLDALAYPLTLQYHRGGTVMTTAPRIVVHDWRQEFVHLVAHEAFHTRQFREQLSMSEVTAERWALQAVTRVQESGAFSRTDGASLSGAGSDLDETSLG